MIMRSPTKQEQSKSFIAVYGGAVGFVFCALILTLLIWWLVNPLRSPLFLAAIMVSAWWGGFRSGVLAAIISGVCIDYFFVAPNYEFASSMDDVLRFATFVAEGTLISWLIDNRKIAADEIKRSREQLRALSLHQQAVREAERKRIALEIHDELGQSLTGIKMDVFWLNSQINEHIGKTPEISEKLKELLELINSTILSVRRITTDLRPAILDDFGLVAAIEWQAREFERKNEISCLFKTNIESLELESQSAIAVFRIFQETLTNITKHAAATSVDISFQELNGQLTLRVEDDGKGFDPNEKKDSYSLGILGMRERARLTGGELNVYSGSENGTVVELTFPIS